ncbi:hypothetical protein A8709_17675 [Paenibacillus pectinilyticus]|uniref:Uncharacterized protein n=1 Tax=Paenibacillus pectinilyticus TaxID=512399 RepID=A0A1C0ZZ71_9BACL|nr:hypothetical protein [Paenibacillus pectinilyticus]OCT13437.1 hypothetical protein A8709_17675 [Paenibacillus pectinilyticus]
MKKIIVIISFLSIGVIHPVSLKAEVVMPCSAVLEPVSKDDMNVKGAALIYKVKLTPSFPRTSISMHAIHLPAPTTLGDYDGYEGFAFIPNEISWRFKLVPTPEGNDPTWAGKIDDITADLTPSILQIRLSNGKTGKLGPAILENPANVCK